MAYFGKVIQKKITKLTLGNNDLVIGFPMVVLFSVPNGAYQDPNVNDPQIGLYGRPPDESRKFVVKDSSFPIGTFIGKIIVMYGNCGFSFLIGNQIYYFSSLQNGNEFWSTVDPPFGPSYRVKTIVNPPTLSKYNMYRYFTYLNYSDINLNNYTNVLIAWSSDDFPGGDYGDDPVTLSMYTESGDIVTVTKVILIPYQEISITSAVLTNNTELPSITFKNIPSGRYYFKYDFISLIVAGINSNTEPDDDYPDPPYPSPPFDSYTYGDSSSENTPLFTFITQFLQSISATTALPGGTSTIAINVGLGYTGYTYTLSINDENNFSIRTTFPYSYSSPSINTNVYTATVSNSSDTNDPNTRSRTFTAWKYITSISISNRIIQSSQNYLSWIGGRSTESFNYNGTTITTNGSSSFSVGNKVDSSSFTVATAYPIQPSESIENNGSYSPFYFDSIAPSQNVTVVANTVLQTYTISWTSYYTATSPAPDGTRQYTISFYPTESIGSSYTATSTYNIVTIPYSAVTYGVAYTIAVVDIILTTTIYFFDPPTNVTFSPNYINFPNIIRWTSTTPTLNVIMNDLEFQGTPPTEQNLTEDTSGTTGDISFWAVGSTSSNAIVCGTYDLNENSLFLSLGDSVPIFQGIELPFDFGEYLYQTDDFSLSLYRNGEIVQELESSITIPFTWHPYTYPVAYQPNDQLYFKSNEHLNYGISDPFTFTANASVSVDQSVYNLDSTILVTMNIYVPMPSFSVQLQDVDNLYPPIPIDFVRDESLYTFHLQDVLLNINVYRLDFLLTSSPTISISTSSFLVTTPVTIEAYSIYSPVIATLYVDLPTVFDVQLQDSNLYTITLPSFTANLLTRYSFLPSDYGLTDTTYSLTFNPVGLNDILESSFTLVQTATLSLDQSNYTIASTIIAMIDLNTESSIVFSVELQDADNVLAPITLPSFTVNSLSYYSFAPYDYNLTNMGYYFIVRPAGIDIILQSAVFQMSTDYFSLFPISTPVPEFARATTNTLCVTAKKFNVATIIISVVNNIAYASRITGKPQFLVPCGIVKYLNELNKLLITMSLRDALLLLIQKYDIPQSTPAITNQKRYQYPTVIAKVLKPILQYSSSFRLSINTTGNSVNVDRRFVEKLPDARVLTICNDDTKTFSTLYTDMLVKAPYWLNTLQPFKKDGDFTYCVVRPVNGSLKQIITASISLKNNRLVFTPVILRLVLGFYNAYGPIDIAIMYSSNSILDIFSYLVAAYEKIYLNPTTAL